MDYATPGNVAKPKDDPISKFNLDLLRAPHVYTTQRHKGDEPAMSFKEFLQVPYFRMSVSSNLVAQAKKKEGEWELVMELLPPKLYKWLGLELEVERFIRTEIADTKELYYYRKQELEVVVNQQ